MIDSTEGMLIKVSSGDPELLRGTADGASPSTARTSSSYWQSANRDAGEAWIELAMPLGRALASLQLRLLRATEPCGVDTFTPKHVQVHVAEASEAMPEKPHWESLEFWTLGSVGEFFEVPMEYPPRIHRVRLSIKRTASCGLNTRVQAIRVMTRRLKRQREDEVPNRLWADRDFDDCVVQCSDGQEIRAHRVVLATASPVFGRMLSLPMQEGSRRVVRLPASFQVVRAMARFCYGLRPEPTLALDEELMLMEQAHLYELMPLCEEVAVSLVEKVCKDTVVPILKGLRTYYKEGALRDEWAALVTKVHQSRELTEAFFLES